ncbi:MAG: hypothetical protein AAFY26_20720 [Cyanobacteria bacterium J06638_22]
MLFNMPATHELVLDRVTGSTVSNIVTIPCRIRGSSKSEKTQQILSELEQVRRIAKFWAFLMEDDDGKPQATTWQYVIPGYTAYFFWANALLSRYCDFWGVE